MSEAIATTPPINTRRGPLTDLIGVDEKQRPRGHASRNGLGQIEVKLGRLSAEVVEDWKTAESQLRAAGLAIIPIHEWDHS